MGDGTRGASLGIVILGVVVRLIGNVGTIGGANRAVFGGVFFRDFGGTFFLVVLVVVVVVDFFFFAKCFLEG
jgi:asparagine N-glycosylation enzyme membrane subunit Stt3